MESVDEVIKSSVLIVDDDPLSIFLSERLMKKNYEIKSVASGFEAIAECETRAYDVILMDINLGDLNMDGIRTMKMIRKQGLSRSAIIVALTAFSHSKKWYLDQGFDNLLVKPLSAAMVEGIHLLCQQNSCRKAW